MTGAGGVIGGATATLAAQRGWRVLGASRARTLPGGVTAIPTAATVPDLRAVLEAHRPDAVVHCFGASSVQASFADPMADFGAAVGSWHALLEATRLAGHHPVLLFPSSAAVYGNPELPVAEEAPLRPISPYGFHKVTAELLAREYAEVFGLRVIVGRLFSILAPRQRRLVAHEVFRQAAAGQGEIWLEGTGDETRDFLHVDDAADAFLRLIEAHPAEAGLDVVNVASGQEVRVHDLAAAVTKATGAGAIIRARGASRPGNPDRWCADVRRLTARVGRWAPRSLEDALRDCARRWEQSVDPVEAR